MRTRAPTMTRPFGGSRIYGMDRRTFATRSHAPKRGAVSGDPFILDDSRVSRILPAMDPELASLAKQQQRALWLRTPFWRGAAAGRAVGYIALAVVCVFFGGSKIIPGGPFISFTGDILPHGFTAAAVVVCFRSYRSSSTGQRVILLILAGLAASLSLLTISSTYSFWTRPYARGSLFGI